MTGPRSEQPTEVVTASVRGAAHVRQGRPNQDAVATSTPGALPLVVAVADGHGSDRSFRSDRGSTLAVHLAVEVLSQLAAGPDAAALIASQGLGRVWEAWVAAVLRDAADDPLPEAIEAEDEALLAYGATLIAAVVTSGQELVCLQLGDGDLVGVAADGVVERLLPADELHDGTSTTSLCLPDAPSYGRATVLPLTSGPALLLLATDGYGNSFADDDAFLQVGRDLLAAVQRDGVEDLRAQLPAWLDETSREGSGDDVTAAVVVLPVRGGDGWDELATTEPSRRNRPSA